MDNQELIELLKQWPSIKLAILFGSFANGSPSFRSDIDLAVWAEPELTAELKIDIIGAITKKLGRPVDLININTAGEPILGQVLGGKKLFGDSTLHARLLTRHVIDNADFMPLRQRTLKERRDNWIP